MNIQFRLIHSEDDVSAINLLLRAAYQPLANAGMKYAASHENVEATRKNILDGECYLGFAEDQLIACVVLRIPEQSSQDGWKHKKPEWYLKPGVTSFGRFAVHPAFQRKGIGHQLMDFIESRAKELKFQELALDTSENAMQLIEMYKKRGYRFIEYHQWEITNYRSVVLSKTL